MKKLNFTKGAKRTIAGFLAVTIAAGVIVPLSLRSSAAYASLNYIEEIKQNYNESMSSYKILEILPDTTETTMGYYIDGSDPVSNFVETAQQAISADTQYDSSTRQAARINYMNNTAYATLASKGAIGSTDSYPIKNERGYREFYPWETKYIEDNGIYSNDDYPVDELLLDAPDTKTVTGTYTRTDVEGGEMGDYELSAIYTLASDGVFNFKEWANNSNSTKSSSSYMTVTTNTLSKTILCTQVGSNSTTDYYTHYANSSSDFKNYYSMRMVPGATYKLSFDVTRPTGWVNGQVFLFSYDKNGNLVKSNKTWTENYVDPWGNNSYSRTKSSGDGGFWYYSNQGGITYGHYEITFTVPEGCAYSQFRFGTCESKTYQSGSVRYSNISLTSSGGGNYVQNINHFEYVTTNDGDTDEDYYYDVVGTPLCTRDQWNNITEGTAIYTKEVTADGTEYYEYVGTTQTGSTIDIDNDKAFDADNPYYYTLSINTEVYAEVDTLQVLQPVVTEAYDGAHHYKAIPNYDITYSGEEIIKEVPIFTDVPAGTGYFNSDQEVLTYTPGEGRYDFVEDPDGEITTTITTSVVYYDKGLSSNNLFLKQVMDCYDGDAYPYFFASLYTKSTADMVDDEEFVSSIKFRDLIVLSGGMGLVNSEFKADIPKAVKDEILRVTDSENKIPIIVDLSILAKITKDEFPNLYSLVTTLISQETTKGISVENGGVSNNIYVYSMGDISGAKSFATDKFNSDISGAGSLASPYYDVYSEIHDENIFRTNYKDGNNIPEITSQATCIRSIINFAGHRVRNLKNEIRVLDIEPYTSREYSMFSDKDIEKGGIATLSALEVIKWMPDTMVKETDDGYIYNMTVPIKNEEDAEKVIKITTMSVAELNTCNYKIVENYDMVYVGASVDNLVTTNPDTNRAQRYYGTWLINYNDKNLSGSVSSGSAASGLIYTSMGDTFMEGNVGDFMSGDTLAGLLRKDYAELAKLKSGTSLTFQTWNLPSNYEFEARTAGNDITAEVRQQLEQFAASGMPVIFASDLCEVPQTLTYSIDVQNTAYYRRIITVNKKSTYQYFVFFVAHLNGKVPAGVDVEWTWYYQSSDVNGGKPYEIKAKGNGGDEPISKYYDEDTQEWYSTLGSIQWDGTIGVNGNYDGMALPDPNANTSTRPYQRNIGVGVYYAQAKLVANTNSANKNQLYNSIDPIKSSNYVTYTEDRYLDVDIQIQNRSSDTKYGGLKTITITPNPYYTDQLGFGSRATAEQVENWKTIRKWGGTDEQTHFDLMACDSFPNKDYQKGGDEGHKKCTVNTPEKLVFTAFCTSVHKWALTKNYDFFTFYVYGKCKCYGTADFVSNCKASEDIWLGNYSPSSSKEARRIYYTVVMIKEQDPKQEPVTVDVPAEGFNFAIDMDVVDNTTNLYQFMSQTYNTVTATADEIRAAKEEGYLLENRTKLSNVMSVYEIGQDSGKRLGECLQISSPDLVVDERSLESYDEDHPKTLTNNTLKVTFRINCDTDVSSSKYKVNLYIDADHDAVYRSSEQVAITLLKNSKGETAPKENGSYVIKSSSTNEDRLNIYTLEKQVPSTYQGVLPWRLEIEDTDNPYFRDSYTGYAYVTQDEATVINCLQILPADQWSNAKNGVKGGLGNMIQYTDYALRGAWMGTSARKNPEAGNAYKGSVFMGVDSKTWYGGTSNNYNLVYDFYKDETYTKTSEDDTSHDFWKYDEYDYANDAFYQLTIEPNAKLKRTVYYEDIGTGTSFYKNDDDKSTTTSGIRYRTHVVLWVNSSGEAHPERNLETGETLKDYFGREIMVYDDCDFKVDIALTDIYELNNYIYKNEKSAEMNKNWLNQYDMLVLGFGDNYGRSDLAEYVITAKALQGFNQYTAWAIDDFVKTGKPMLFCHDTCNHETNFIKYFAQTAVAGLSEMYNAVAEWWTDSALPALDKAWTSVKNWWYDLTGQPDKKTPPKVEVSEELENDIDAVGKDSRITVGYYNNLLMRVPLKQDRYGITYMINKVMDDSVTHNADGSIDYIEKNGQTHWQAENYKAGHYYSWILGTGTDKNGNRISSAEADGYVTEVEMLAEGFTIANMPGTAVVKQLASGDSVVMYKYYTNQQGEAKDGINYGSYTYITDTDRKGNKTTETRTYKNYEEYIVSDFTNDTTRTVKFGGQVAATKVYETQGFTSWMMTRYSTKDHRSTYIPIGVGERKSDSSPYMTDAVVQVNKGSITTYPYDINTSEFGGTADTDSKSAAERAKYGADGKIKINPTHEQVYQVNLDRGETTVWYTLADPSGTNDADRNYDLIPKDGLNSYYIFTSGNLTYTGAGHSNMFTVEEAKLFINTLIAAYRITEENPTVTFRDETDSNVVSYKVVSAEYDRTYTPSDTDTTSKVVTPGTVNSVDDNVVIAVKVIDPNITNSGEKSVTLRFATEIEGSDLKADTIIDMGTLYTSYNDGVLGGTMVTNNNGYVVDSDTTYYIKVPASVLNKLKTDNTTVIYAQGSLVKSPTTVSVPVSLEFRRLGLDVLS